MNRDRKLRRGDEAWAIELQIAYKRRAIYFFPWPRKTNVMFYLARIIDLRNNEFIVLIRDCERFVSLDNQISGDI